MNRIFITLFFLLSAHILVAQSPWVLSKHGYYIQFLYNTIPEYKTLFYGNDNTFETSRKIQDKTLQLYAEYGITDKFTVIASIPYKVLQSGDINPDFEYGYANIPPSDKINSLGNIQLSLKYSLFEKNWVSALQLRIETPVNEETGFESGLKPGFHAYSIAPILSIGRGWNRIYSYYWASGIIRSNKYSEYINTGLEAGWRAFPGLWLIAYLEVLSSLKNGSRELPPPEKQFGLYSNDLEYFAYGIKLIYEIRLKNEHSIGFIAHGAGSFAGFAVAKSPLLSLGIYIKH